MEATRRTWRVGREGNRIIRGSMYQWPDLHLLLVVRCLSNLPCPLRRSVICGRSVAEGIFICNGYGINGNRGVNFLSRLRKRTRDQQINVLQSTSLQKIIRAIRHKIGTKIILLNGACYHATYPRVESRDIWHHVCDRRFSANLQL